MIYLVTGFPKSGTSGMMGSLDAGGLSVLNDLAGERILAILHDSEGRKSNPRYWEPSPQQIAEWDFPRAYDGYALKWVTNFAPSPNGVQVLAPHEYSVVVMRRHPEELRQSFEAMVRNRGIFAPEWLDYGPNQQGEYDRRIDLMLEHIEDRSDMTLNRVVRYREDLIDNPLATFRSLGWPIDAEAAAVRIKPELCYAKLEQLTVGI